MPGLAQDSPSLLTQAADLVSATRKTFYPQEIPVQHRQLRHFLKASDSGFVYYATRKQVYALKGAKRKLIARLDFDVQCLTAGFGWLCLGGPEKGQCAFLRLQMGEEDAFFGQANSEVDTLLPLNLRSLAHSGSPEGLRHVRSNSWSEFPQSARAIHYKKLGEEIVNAITLQKIPSAKDDGKQETVAVVATNDFTTTVYSLDRLEPLHTLFFHHEMNHASISPDGSLLVACGDTDSVFFFLRRKSSTGKSGEQWTNEWKPIAAPKIKSFGPLDHCFTTAFSPNGKYCTVASQAGHLVKMDVRAICADMDAERATVEWFTSSRPAPKSCDSVHDWRGAIRSSVFSSSVWGLLVWSETRGRVCVADMRNSNRPTQVIRFTKSDPTNDTIELVDAVQNDMFDDDEPFSQTLRRMGSQRPSNSVRDQLNDVTHAVDYLEEAAQHRRLQQLLRSLEREVPTYSDEQPRLQDLMNEIREMGEDLDNLETSAGSRAIPPPRRRSSVVFSNGEQRSSTTMSSSLRPILPQTSNLSASPSQLARDQSTSNLTPPLPSPGQSSSFTADTDPWQTISAAMASSTDSRPHRASLEANLRNLRETRDSLQRAQRESRVRAEQLSREMRQERQNATRLRASRDPVIHSSTTARSTTASQGLRSLYEPDNQTRSDLLEHSLDESAGRLSQVERDLAQLERSRARLYNSTIEHYTEPETRNYYLPNTTLASVGAREGSRDQTARNARLLRVHGPARGHLPPGEDASLLRYRDEHDSGTDDEEVQIMGLDWSHDGRLLFVATSVGIFELKVNVTARRTFPAPSQAA